MALPLPRVVSDVGPGGGVVTAMRGMNALSSDMLNNKINSAVAQYAPYNQYADAASKIAYANMLPYQIQATTMSNPLIWMALKDNPGAINAMMQNFSRSIPTGGNIFGNVQLPSPNSMGQGNGLLNMILKKIGGDESQSSSADMNNMPVPTSGVPNGAGSVNTLGQGTSNISPTGQPSNALLPGAQGGMEGYMGKLTAPYTQSPYAAGTLIPDPNNPGGAISVSTGRMTTALQTAVNAAKRVEPQLQRIATEAEPFMSAGGQGKLQLQRLGNYFAGKKGDLPTKYAKFQSDLAAAPEALVKSYGLNPTNETIERMARVIEPYNGETGEQYKARILGTLENIRQEQIGVGEQQLAQGISIPKEQVQPANQDLVGKPKNVGKIMKDARIAEDAEKFKNTMIQMRGIDPKDKKMKLWNVPTGKAQSYIDAGFTRVS